MSQTPSPEPDSTTQDTPTPFRNFLIGLFLSGVPVFAYLSLSVDMTYGSWATVETGRLVGAIALPLLCGLLSAIFGNKVVQFLDKLLTSVTLPF